uniref:Uncharacterized protein n=1 Tax=Chloropicon laureae TaxID=464258 RepID=A0A7S2YX58_9CHLO
MNPRFRPIAPRPRPQAGEEQPKAKVAKVEPKAVEAKKPETLAKQAPVDKQPQVVTKQAAVVGRDADISLDPKNFVYPDLKPAVSGDSAMSSGQFYNHYYNGMYYNASAHMPMQPMYYGQSLNSQYTPGNTVDNAIGMKLDLDQDSVAKAFDKQEERGRESSVEESAPTSARPAGAENATAATKVPANNNANNAANAANGDAAAAANATNEDGCGMATSGSRTKLKISSFQNCISNGSTNPLFHIEKGLACNFIRDFLSKHNIDDISALGA